MTRGENKFDGEIILRDSFMFSFKRNKLESCVSFSQPLGIGWMNVIFKENSRYFIEKIIHRIGTSSADYKLLQFYI